MSEFFSRTGPVSPVAAVQERSQTTHGIPAARSMRSGIETGTRSVAGMAERTTGAADYAKIQANIADVLARIQSSGGTKSVAPAEQAIVAMMPNPVVMLPMPPTDPDIIAFVAQVGQSLAQQAVQARAAQATTTPIMVEAAAN